MCNCLWNLAHLLQSEYNKKITVKRSRNVERFFYKNNAEKNGMFQMQIMLKGGNKHARIIWDTCFSYQYGHKNSVAYFHFEQLSIITVVSLLLTFNKYTASGVLSFSVHYFYISKSNQWEWTQVYIRTSANKQIQNEL